MKIIPKTLTWLVVALLLVSGGIAFMFWSYQQISGAAVQRQHTRNVIGMANRLLSGLKDADTGQRGYALTGNENYLQPYLAVRDRAIPDLNALREEIGNTGASASLDSLAPLIEAKMLDLASGIAMRRAGDQNAVPRLMAGGNGERLMGDIRFGLEGFVQRQTETGLRNEASFDVGMRRLLLILFVVAALALLLALDFSYLVFKKSRQRVKNLVHLETLHLLQAQEDGNALLAQANQRLQEGEQRLWVTLNSIGDGVVTTDVAGRITLLNPVAEALTGWTQAQALGQPADAVLHMIHKESRTPATLPVAAALADGTVQKLANHMVLIARDAREFDISDSCAPIRDASAQVVGAVLVFRNISDEYAAQQAVRDSSALVQTILNTVVDGMVTVNADGGIVETNNPAIELMFGFTGAELIGKPLSLLIPELDLDQRLVSLERYRASGEARAVGVGREVVGQRKDGGTFPLEMTVTEVTLRGKRYFTGILRDLSTRKQVDLERARLDQVLQNKNAELELARRVADHANQAKSDFLSSMSHELRSPLNAILGFAQLLESGTPPPSPGQAASIAQILTAGWYLLKLINEILDLTLIESGRLSLSLEPTSLRDVLHDCQAMIAPQAQQKGIRTKFPPIDIEDCFVIADRTRLKQVLVNLLTNAIKYNRPNGTVEVSHRLHSAGRLRISVRDSGEGLSPAKISQLFQPFNRLGQEAGAEEGTGIGLVVSRQLVELMEGEIGVTSTVGVGSVFWFELSDAHAPEFSSADLLTFDVPKPLLTTGERVRTLLYVEDNQANMALVEQLIERRADLRLLGAADAMRGIALARTHQPELILMDINLPGISGVQALAILRADPTTRQIPVLALSANAMPRDIEKGLEAGFFRYLTKPVRVPEFMTALDEALALADVDAPLALGPGGWRAGTTLAASTIDLPGRQA